jgi:hypothetical protein
MTGSIGNTSDGVGDAVPADPEGGSGQDFLDGNSVAGPLASLFAIDVTTAFFVCIGCGRRDRIATLRVYNAGLGVVARCAGCDHVVLRYARTPAGVWLDSSGTVVLQFPAADASGETG